MPATLKINRAIIRRIPFGLAKGLNGTATRAKTAMETHIDRTFDRPTPFTRRALTVQRASTTKPRNVAEGVIVQGLAEAMREAIRTARI